MLNAELLVTLILGLVDRAASIGALLNKAKSEGRDITSEEIDAEFAKEAVARAELQAAVDAARAKGNP
jgi:hypothetical protein